MTDTHPVPDTLRRPTNAAGIIRWITSTRGAVLASLLLLGGLFRPYAGIEHDARLYAIQLQHHITPGVHDDDLYLKFGSQDRYSLFSLCALPLAETVGVETAFLILYLAGTGCWLYAVSRFVPALVRQRVAALAALVYIAAVEMPFGGTGTFHIHERFLTPRLWAVGLVVLSFERLVRRRPLASFGWLVLAMLLHPIMGFGGMCVWFVCQLMSVLKPRVFAALLVAGLGTVVGLLLCEPIAALVFGQMDEVWRSHVTGAHAYFVPLRWEMEDWAAVVLAFSIVAIGRTIAPLKPPSRRLLDATLVVAGVGLAFGAWAPMLPYKLLLQGQAYRAVWLVQLMQIPVLFSLVERLIRRRLSPAGTSATVVVVLGFVLLNLSGWQIVAGALLLLAIRLQTQAGRQPSDDEAKTQRQFAAAGFCAAVALTGISIAMAAPVVWTYLEPLEAAAFMLAAIGPFFIFCLAIAIVLVAVKLWGRGGRFVTLCVATWLLVHTAYFYVPSSSLYASIGVEDAENVAFVEDYLDELPRSQTSDPTIYWPAAPLDDVWCRLRCNSFFSKPQIAGNMFQRGTAIEGHRRARLTRAFELDALQELLRDCSATQRASLQSIFGGPLTPSVPRLEDLLRVCSESTVDIVVTERRFEGWYAATNGRLFIYDARQIRDVVACASDDRSVEEEAIDERLVMPVRSIVPTVWMDADHDRSS